MLCQRLFEINEDMVQILLMLGVHFTQDSKVEDLFNVASARFSSCANKDLVYVP